MDVAEALKHQLVDAHRILAATGCVREIVGHASARIPGTDEMVVRCRRPDDPGVEFTTLADIKRVDLDGHSTELGTYALQGEFAIHAEIYRARPDVGAIVHGHARASLLCGMLDVPLRPILGAFDPGMLEIVARPVPVFSQGILISTPALGRELAATLGDAPVCLLRAHGMVAVGADVADATTRAIKLETLAELTLQAHGTGRTPHDLAAAEVERVLARWRPQALAQRTWAHYRRTFGLA